MKRSVQQFIQCWGVALLLLLSPNVSKALSTEFDVNPAWQCPYVGPGNTAYAVQYGDLIVYWEGIGGAQSYLYTPGQGGCGGSISCDGFDLITGCEPDWTYSANCDPGSTYGGRASLRSGDYAVSCTAYTCNPPTPVGQGWECYCQSNYFSSSEVEWYGPCS